jgi:hypothetical protein
MVRFSRLAPRSLALLAALAFARPTVAAPVPGFVEDFPGTSTSTWSGGAVITNPGTGGLHGVDDGYLQAMTVSPSNLGTVSFGAEYAGDWTAAGITQVRCWLTDAAWMGNLSIHFSLSDGSNTWQHDAGFVPPMWEWGLYVIPLVEADFTHIRGITGTFATVMANVDRIHFRHDLPPFEPTPDPVAGAFGLDHLVLTNGLVGVGDNFAARPVLLDPPYPNPARGRVTLQLRQPEALPVRLSIFDAAGRRVREVTLDAVGPASRLWLWDGTDDAGVAVPAGVYRVLARGDNGGMSRTVTLIR